MEGLLNEIDDKGSKPKIDETPEDDEKTKFIEEEILKKKQEQKEKEQREKLQKEE